MDADAEAAFGELLRHARRKAGLTQEALAERAGVSARAITDLERGVNQYPRRDTLDMLAVALDLPIDERRHWERMRREHSVRSRSDASTRKQTGQHLLHSTLPVQLTRFFGRETEIERLARMIGDEGHPLVTLVGPGGSGKTRLAIEVATRSSDAYPDGLLFIDLSPVSDADLVLSVMATAFGLHLQGGQTPEVALAEWIGARHILLVLDNVEQVLAAGPAIGRLLDRCEQLQILITSRAPLRLRAEHEFLLAPLPIPAIDELHVEDYDAVQLFIDRARAVRPAFAPDTAGMLAIAGICRYLDGLPLAIELAAACIRLFAPSTILERLAQHMPLPAAGYRDAPARQRTMHDTIVWSHDLLQSNERAVLRRLSIFKGGWTLQAAEEVVAGEGERSDQVVHHLHTLLEHNLIYLDHVSSDASRFAMLETIREFGVEQLALHHESQVLHRRLARYLLRTFTGSEADWHSPRELATLRLGDAESENLRLALDWSLVHDVEIALRLARELAWYWFTRGAIREAKHWLEQALASAERVPDELRAGALNWVGSCATTLGDYEEAELAQEQAYVLYQRLGDAAGVAVCLHSLARNAMWSGDLERAEVLYEGVADLFRQLNHVRLQTILENLGLVLIARNKLDRAVVVLEEALVHAEQRGLTWDRAAILDALAAAATKSGDVAQARKLLGTSLMLHREAQDPRCIAQFVEGCAWLAITEGAAEHAGRLLGAASTIRHSIGVPVDPFTRASYDGYVPLAQAQIGSDVWDRALSEGRSISQTDAIELAMQRLQ